MSSDPAHVAVAGRWSCDFARPARVSYELVDLQPPGDVEAWDSVPFDPPAGDEWLVERGSADILAAFSSAAPLADYEGAETFEVGGGGGTRRDAHRAYAAGDGE